MAQVAVGVGEESLREAARLSLAKASLAAVASGVLYFLAFPGMDLWPLAFVALVPLRIALFGQTSKRAFWLGWLTGFTLISLGFYWMVGMLASFSGFPTAVCVLFALVVNAFQAGRMGFFAWLFVRAERHGWPPGLVWLAALAAMELAYPVLFWWSFGAVLHPASALTQVADLGGIIAVGLVAAAANWAIGEGALARFAGRPLPLRATLPYALTPLAALAYGVLRIAQVDKAIAAAPHSELGLVQGNLGLMAKRHDAMESLRRHLVGTLELVTHSKPELVLWSETVVTRALQLPTAGEVGQRALAANVGAPLLFGALLREDVSDARHHVFHNSALIADATGIVRGRYDKQELVPFSEKMPFGRELPWLYAISPNSGRFEATNRIDAVPFGEHRIAVTICNDDVTPSATRRVLGDPNTDLIVNLTNDAWFGDTTEPWIHLALAKFRAIEHRRFFVRATNSGVSAFIDPVGRVLAKTDTFRETTLSDHIAWLRARTVYELVGDWPYWLGGAFVIFAAFRRRPGARGPT
jgi:apolipoprotein N-acyltransferase